MARHFRYNTNGNPPLDLMLGMDKVRTAALSLMEALSEASGTCSHGRNYQTVENNEGSRAEIEDRRFMHARYREVETIRRDAEATMLELMKDPRVRRAWDEEQRRVYDERQRAKAADNLQDGGPMHAAFLGGRR